MFKLPTTDCNGGRRTYKNVPVVVEKISEERYWRKLWLKKSQRISFKLSEEIKFQDEDEKEEIIFPQNIIIHDLYGDFLETKIGDVLNLKIGYANKNQQHRDRVNAFFVSILEKGELTLVY